MLDAAIVAEIRRLYYAEHWKIGTIAAQLGVHPDAVGRALNRPLGPAAPRPPRPRITDPYLPFLTETLERYPRLRATVLYRMLRERGFAGSVVQLRRVVRTLRPSPREAFLLLRSLPGEAAQVDWADFGPVTLGRARRRLSAFVLTLSYSRAAVRGVFLRPVPGQLPARPRTRLRALRRRAASPAHRQPALGRAGAPRRAIPLPPALSRAGRPLLLPAPSLSRRPRQREGARRALHPLPARVLLRRPWLHHPGGRQRRRASAGTPRSPTPAPGPTIPPAPAPRSSPPQEQSRLLALPQHRLDTSERIPVRSAKTLWVRFDRNDYSIPPDAVGKDLVLCSPPRRASGSSTA